ncbi:MAG: hypothetical protein MZV64_09140 [Ignavibacteriales bacterium]|nr:hypothetical protein [Ignavibacteriales bacterium]
MDRTLPPRPGRRDLPLPEPVRLDSRFPNRYHPKSSMKVQKGSMIHRLFSGQPCLRHLPGSQARRHAVRVSGEALDPAMVKSRAQPAHDCSFLHRRRRGTTPRCW